MGRRGRKRPRASLIRPFFADSYFLTYFFKSMRNSAPYTLPWASKATPSAMLEPADRDPGVGQSSLYGYGAGSGMKYFTEPSRALPIRMPRRTPGSYPKPAAPSHDSESAM